MTLAVRVFICWLVGWCVHVQRVHIVQPNASKCDRNHPRITRGVTTLVNASLKIKFIWLPLASAFILFLSFNISRCDASIHMSWCCIFKIKSSRTTELRKDAFDDDFMPHIHSVIQFQNIFTSNWMYVPFNALHFSPYGKRIRFGIDCTGHLTSKRKCAKNGYKMKKKALKEKLERSKKTSRIGSQQQHKKNLKRKTNCVE